MKRILALIAAALMLAVMPSPVMAQAKISASAAGISIVMPEGWSQVPTSVVMAHLLELDQNNPEFTRVIKSGAADPVIAIARYPKTYPAIAPSIKIGYMYLPDLKDQPLTRLVTGSVEQVRIAFGAVDIVEPAAEIRFSGLPAAHVRIRFDVKGANGIRYGNVSDLWVIRRGDYYFLIGATWGESETPEVVDQLHGAIDSIVIAPE